ncbi:nop10 ribonucleoprotein isoform X2 [Colletes latitarsis]|uniref:nop10 ribonucleoprotein isoform X2 n=1 Tax=Colletes latitarsis TaxID=2605962 RepID=UPI0040363874
MDRTFTDNIRYCVRCCGQYSFHTDNDFSVNGSDTLYSDYLPVRCADHACLNADFAKKNCQNFYTHGPVAYICEQSVLSSTRYSDLNKSIWASTYHCATYACVTKVHTFNSSTTRCNRCKQNRSKWKTHIVSTSSSIFSRR